MNPSTPAPNTSNTNYLTPNAPGGAPSSSSGHRRGRSSGGAMSQVPRNAQGGVLVNPLELRQAFEFLDSDGKGYITLADLKKRLSVFYGQQLSLKEYRFLMNNKQELTEQDLYALLASNELTDFDPVREAFKVYDPQQTGYVDIAVFKEILGNLGFGDITDHDIKTLIETADVDGDGKISLEDFRKMLPTAGGGTQAAINMISASSPYGNINHANNMTTPKRH